MNIRSKNRNGERNHVLILDDEEGSRVLLARIGEEVGYETCIASNIDELIQQFALNQPTFLILDVFLGNEKIETIFGFLRSQRYTGPVALVSGYAVREMDALVADAVGKGILIAGLFEKVSMFTTLRKQLEVYYRGARVA